jgi:hypothetical protein
MNHQLLARKGTEFDQLLDSPGDNSAKQRIRELARLSPMAQQLPAASYDVFTVRRNSDSDAEIFSQKNVLLGTYRGEDLYGTDGSRIVAFKSALQGLRLRVEQILKIDAESVEYAHQVALLWSDVGHLKDFLGTSPEITELVAELRTARFQFLRRDTPVAMLDSMAKALRFVGDSPRWNAEMVDRFVEILEEAGFDSLAIDGLRRTDA